MMKNHQKENKIITENPSQSNNLKTRVLVAIIAIPLILILSYLGKYFFLAFILLIGILSFNELTKLVKLKNININFLFGELAIILIILNSYFIFFEFIYLILLIVILSFIIELFRTKGSAILNLGSLYFGIFYISFFLSTSIGTREFFIEYKFGGYFIISIFASIWICDSAAYFVGLKYGIHKLFKRVSPNKSWEGAVAGFIFAIFTMVILKLIALQFLTIVDAIVIGLIIGIFGQIGDLVESLLKRDVNIKDSSNLIPGHGGVLDRFDSFLFVSPIIYLYLKIFF
ncbi:MAG: phosphatidate cytidylyltransferase [Ignavibacterium sp.]